MYGCGVFICLSGGFGKLAILSRSLLVQSMFGISLGGCASIALHVSIDGFKVVMRAYSMCGVEKFIIFCCMYWWRWG